MWKRFEKWLHPKELLLLVLITNIFLRLPSLFEPYWYGDEAIYLTVGKAINSGVKLYSQIHDNKPPFIYLLAALAHGDQFWFKFIAMVWSTITVWFFYRLAKYLWSDNLKANLTTAIFVLFTSLPFWEGNIANAELFFVLPTILAFTIILKSQKNQQIFYGGVLLGLATLFKIPAAVEILIWPLVWIFKKDSQWWKKSFWLGVGMGIPILLSIIYFASTGRFNDYVSAVWVQNIPYAASWKTASGTGVYALKGRIAILILMLVGVWTAFKKEEEEYLSSGLWILMGVFAVLLSARPYPHYLLQITPAVSLLLAVLVWGKPRTKLLAGSGIALLLISIVTFKFWTYPVASYWENFLKWTAGGRGKSEYSSWFNPDVMSNYEIATTIVAGSQKTDRVFVWGDQPMVYALAKRIPATKYTVKYHIGELHQEASVMQILETTPPRYIVTWNNESELGGLPELLKSRYKLEKRIGNGQVYRLVLTLSMTD